MGEGQRQFLDVPYVTPTLCNELYVAQFHAKIHKIEKKKTKKKSHCEVNILLIIINGYFIIYHSKGQPFRYLKQFFFNIGNKLYYLKDIKKSE